MTNIKEPVLGREVAEQHFNDFCEEMDLDNDPNALSEDEAKSFNENKEMIVSALMSGRLTFSDNWEPTLNCERSGISQPLIFREPNAADYMAMDRQKSGKDVGKMISMMDSVTRSTPGTCAKLKGKEFKIAQAIMVLFMA